MADIYQRHASGPKKQGQSKNVLGNARKESSDGNHLSNEDKLAEGLMLRKKMMGLTFIMRNMYTTSLSFQELRAR